MKIVMVIFLYVKFPYTFLLLQLEQDWWNDNMAATTNIREKGIREIEKTKLIYVSGI